MIDLQERAVRRYLAYLADPNHPDAKPGADEIAELESQLESNDDPIVKLRALSEIERAKRFDRASLETAFVIHAYDWAKNNYIDADAFRHLGVTPELLSRAGFGGTELPQNGSKRANRSSARTPTNPGASKSAAKKTGKRPIAPPVRVDRVNAIIRAQKKRFTVAQIKELSGTSQMTARTAVLTLLASGDVREAGEKAGARGPAAMTYEVVKKS